MVKFCDECIDSSDWIEEITGYRPVDDLITINELNEIAQDPNKYCWNFLPKQIIMEELIM